MVAFCLCQVDGYLIFVNMNKITVMAKAQAFSALVALWIVILFGLFNFLFPALISKDQGFILLGNAVAVRSRCAQIFRFTSLSRLDPL